MNLLFDLDGTLADPFSAFRSSLHYAFNLHSMQAPSDEEIRKCIGPPLHISLEKILNVPPALAPQILKDYRAHHVDRGLEMYSAYPGTEDLLKAVCSNHKIFLATSKPIVMASRVIEILKLGKYFSALYGSELDGVRSIKGDLIKYILETEKLNPKETLMIGDRYHDVVGAKSNSIQSLGVTWGFGDYKELQEAGADPIFDKPYELSAWLIK